ncbi:MAG: hypothetical protein WAP08_08315, partial [Smithellaceae bacterium]|nr:hypothetical protein [Syntrophaceae bacterium]
EDFGFLKETLGRLTDPPETDRIRLEFATLCNTLIAAGSYACLARRGTDRPAVQLQGERCHACLRT